MSMQDAQPSKKRKEESADLCASNPTAKKDPEAAIAGQNVANAFSRKEVDHYKKIAEEERKRRREAEEREAVVLATYGASEPSPGADDTTPAAEIDLTLNRLDEDLRNLIEKVLRNTDIPDPTRHELAVSLDAICNVLLNGPSQVEVLKNRAAWRVYVARRGCDRAEAELFNSHNELFELMNKPELGHEEAAKIISGTKAMVLSITKQLQAFNRHIHVPITASAMERGGATITKNDEATTPERETDTVTQISTAETNPQQSAPDLQCEASKLYSDMGLSLGELLEEFNLAARRPIKDSEYLQTLSEENRVLRAQKLHAEKIEAAASNALNIAQLKLQLIGKPDQDLQELQEEGLEQLERWYQNGTERTLEILRLRDELRVAGKDPNLGKPLGSPEPDDGDQSFIIQETRAFVRVLDDSVAGSQQYQMIIDALENQLEESGSFLNSDNAIFHAEKSKTVVPMQQQGRRFLTEKVHQCNFFRDDARHQRRALGKYIETLTPAYDASKVQKNPDDNDLNERNKRHGELQDEIGRQDKQIKKYRSRIKEHISKEIAWDAQRRGIILELKQTRAALTKCLEGNGDDAPGGENKDLMNMLKTAKEDAEAKLERCEKNNNFLNDQIQDLRIVIHNSDDRENRSKAHAQYVEQQMHELQVELEGNKGKAERNRIPPRIETPSPTSNRMAPPTPPVHTVKKSPSSLVRRPTPPSESPISEDTPLKTPGGTKRKARPGARLRRETRANKRREIDMYKNNYIKDPYEPKSPDDEADEP